MPSMAMIQPVLTFQAQRVSFVSCAGLAVWYLCVLANEAEIDRLPTVPASQALEELKADPAAHISTGLAALDCALLGLDSEDSQNAAVHGGVKRGQVTEIWGPPGCGKTALG